jgi:hypothetical protein
MRNNFFKATLISFGACAIAGMVAVLGGFPYALFLLPTFQLLWAAFCFIRIIQLRRIAANPAAATQYDRDSYGFALGGAISSAVLLLALVVLTQAV